ncbi:hypothetical protein BH11BAC3_BH11BAC3_02220 [soil metagenome]
MISIVKIFSASLFLFNTLYADLIITIDSKKIIPNQRSNHFNVAGTPITDTGQYIYKDGNTRQLEKMVVPWILYYTNQYRKEHGIDSLKYDGCLNKAAVYHSEYLFNESNDSRKIKLVHEEEPESKYFTGKGPTERAKKAGCEKSCGENALYFTMADLLPEAFADNKKLNKEAKEIAYRMVYEQWDRSKGHRENMLNTDYKYFGVSASIGKRTPVNNYDEMKLVLFGVQVMAY